MAKPGTPLSEMDKEVRAALAEFEKRGVSDDDLEKFKKSGLAEKIYGLEEVSGKVSQLAYFQTFTGNANYIREDLKRIENLKKEDVIRVYQQYIKGKPMVVLSVMTKGTENLKAGSDNYKIDSTGYKAPNYGYDNLKYTKAKDTFNRNVMPSSGPNPELMVPAFTKSEDDGIQFIASKSTEIPVIEMAVAVKGGRIMEQGNFSKAGLTGLFADMMQEDTKMHTAEEMDVLLEKLGSSISFEVDDDRILVLVRTLKSNIKPTLALLEERLLQPKFLPETFDRIKNQNLESLKNAKTRAASVASNAYSRVIYGADHIFGWGSISSGESLPNLTLQDVENYYLKYFGKDQLQLVVVGDYEETDLKDILNRLKKLPKSRFDLPKLPPIKEEIPASKTIYLVNVPKAAQTEFRIGYSSNMVYDATGEYYRCGILNYPLGGAFNSRLNLNLREDKGWTYGARSGFGSNDYTGNFTFSAGIKAGATDSALVEINKEINGYFQNGITQEELKFLKSAIGQSDARKYESLNQKARFIGNILDHNLQPDFVKQQSKILQGIAAEEVNLLAKKWLNPEKMRIVLAGDKERISPGLERIGYKIVEISPEGEPIGK